MSTFMDFAIGLSLVNGISGQINQIVGDFKKLDGVTDEVMKQLSEFKNISITGGLLAGAGVKGLQMTADILDDCIEKAAILQDSSLDLKITMFGTDLLEQSKLPEIEEKMEEIENKAMDISLNTVFNQNEIEQSMLAMSKGGMSTDFILASAAEANANFAEVVRSSAIDTAEATLGLQAVFQLDEEQLKEGLDWVVKYADASKLSALPLQQNIGTPASTAMNLWGNRDNMTNLKETMELMAIVAGKSDMSEAENATKVRNFLDATAQSKDVLTDTQLKLMEEAGWLTEDGESIFLDLKTGDAKDIEQIEKILETTKENLPGYKFNNLLDKFYGDRGKFVASALASKDEEYSVSAVRERASNNNDLDTRTAELAQTASFQMGILQESIDTLRATIGKPFLEPIAKTLQNIVNPALKQTTDFFRNHPEIVKYMTAIAAGGSAFLILAGGIMMVIGLVGSFRLIWAKAGAQIIAHFAPILPILGVVAAVIAVIAGLAFVVYRNWETLKPHFSSIFNHIVQIFGSIKGIFSNFVQAVSPILSTVFHILEKGIVILLNIALPILDNILMMFEGLIKVIEILTEQFKKFTEWTGKGLDKLKSFLGLKKEHKDELGAPIEVGIEQTEQVNKVTNVSTITDTSTMTDLSKYGVDSSVINTDITVSPNYKVDENSMKQMEQIEQVLQNTGIEGVELNPELVVNPDYQVDSKSMEQMQEQLKGMGENTFDFTNMNCTMPDMTQQLSGTIDIMQAGGTDAGNAFVNGLSGTSEAVTAAIQSINNIIQNTLLKKESMFLWGSNLMQSFINGMNSQRTLLMMTASSLATVIGDYLKVQSPSRKGELKTNHLWGGNLIQSFADGMKEKQALLKDTSILLAHQTNGLQNIEIGMTREKNKDFYIQNRATKTEENQKDTRPIYIVIQGGEKRENEIAQEVARELDKRGYGKKKRERSPSLTMSTYGFVGGY